MEAEGGKIILDALLKATNLAEKSPSSTWHEIQYESVEDLLSTRTAENRQFLREFADKYHTEEGAILDVSCGSG